MMIISKRGFAFSFFAIFLVLMIFSFAYFALDTDDYGTQRTFVEARVLSVESEMLYFKDVYMKSILEFSLYNSIEAIVNKSYEDPTFYNNLEKNHSALNEYVFEAMTNGTLAGTPHTFLEGKTISNLSDIYLDNFYENYNANMSINVSNYNVFEQSPYSISLQLDVSYSIETLDDISSWKFNESRIVRVSAVNIYDPQFLVVGDVEPRVAPTLAPVEQFQGNANWSLDTFNVSLTEQYSQVYSHPEYEYTLGSSFLSRLLNISQGLYKNVVGFWSFDHDDKRNRVYDNSQKHNEGKHFGNSRILLSFDGDSIDSTTVIDNSAYKNNASLNGGVSCTSQGVTNNSCSISSGQNISIPFSESLNVSKYKNLSVSFWFKTQEENDQDIFTLGDSSEGIKISFDSGNISFQLGTTSDDVTCVYSQEYNNSQWNHLAFSATNSSLYFYYNGVSQDICNISSVSIKELMGENSLVLGENYQGEIDEFALYSKALSPSEVASLYSQKKVIRLDYRSSLYGKGIYYDGVDDYSLISTQGLNTSSLEEITLEAWVYPTKEHINHTGIITKGNVINLTGQGDFGLKFRANETGTGECKNSFSDADIRFHVETDSEVAILCWGNMSKYLNSWHHIVGVYDGINISLYWDGIKRAEGPLTGTINENFENITVGYPAYESEGEFFKGVIDEIKIYNRSLSESEIKNNYFNFNSFGKGCCNYLTLINPNLLGYNDSSYNENISYSSKLFYDVYERGQNYNLTLYNVTNITSTQESVPYYNFLVDHCLLEAYQIFSFSQGGTESTANPVRFGNDSTCEDLIRKGIY